MPRDVQTFCRLKYFRCAWAIAWESSRHFATPPLVSPRNDFWKTKQKFHTDDASLPKSSASVWAEANFPRGTTNQKHYPDLGSDASSVWNFCARFSAVISGGNQCWRCEMKAVFFRLHEPRRPTPFFHPVVEVCKTKVFCYPSPSPSSKLGC